MVTVYTPLAAHSDGSFYWVDLYVIDAASWQGGTDGTICGTPYICHVALGGKDETFVTYNVQGDKVTLQDIQDYMSILFDCDPSEVELINDLSMVPAA